MKILDFELPSEGTFSESDFLNNISTVNSSARDYPGDKGIKQVFEEVVARFPDHIAIIEGKETYTYQQLYASALKVANFLVSRNYAAESRVAILMDYSYDAIASTMGAIMAGYAYVPLNEDYPHNRSRQIILDSDARIIIGQQKYIRELIQLQESCDCLESVVVIDSDVISMDPAVFLSFQQTGKQLFDLKDLTDDTPLTTVQRNGSSLAYVIFTSGSTGVPKGVMVEDKSVIRLVRNTNYVHITAEDCLLSLSAFSFDAAIFHVFGSILNGAKMLITTKHELLDPQKLAAIIKANKVTLTFNVTAVFNFLVTNNIECFRTIKRILVGGEAASVAHMKTFLDTYGPGKLVNIYGPTENTTFSTFYDVDRIHENQKSVPIGKPISNSSCYVLDSQLKMVKPNEEGELYLGGDGLARGYMNSPEKNRECFITSPFNQNERLYKTGDIVKWNDDYDLVFVGRADKQVKVRGYRIELTEIELALLKVRGVSESYVTVSVINGEKQIVAYVVSNGSVNEAAVKEKLSEELPDFMMPAFFVFIPKLPLNINGKVDVSKLPAVNTISSESDGFVDESDPVALVLKTLWEEILGRSIASGREDFFELGGNSLKITVLSFKIHEKFEVRLSLKELFEKRSFQQQLELLKSIKKERFESIPVISKKMSYDVLPIQKGLWAICQLEGGRDAYNVPGSFKLEGPLNMDVLKKSLLALIERHESLRTIFKNSQDGKLKMIVLDIANCGFELEYFNVRNSAHPQEEAREIIRRHRTSSFDLGETSLLKACLIEYDESRFMFEYMLHHIISDGWSINVMMRDLLKLYALKLEDAEKTLPPLRIQFKDYVYWSLEQLASGKSEDYKKYWTHQFKDQVPVMDLPADFKRPAIKTFKGGTLYHVFNATDFSVFKAKIEKKESTLFMGLIALMNALFYKYTAQTDMVIGTPIAGREHADLENQIGYFLNTLPLRVRFGAEDSFDTLLQNVRQTTLDAYENQAYPFNKIVEDVYHSRDLSRNALFDVMVVLQNNELRDTTVANIDLKGLTVKPNNDVSDYPAGKFDLVFNFAEIQNKLALSVEYNSDLFRRSAIERLLTHLDELLNSVINQFDGKISELNCLPDTEKAQILEYSETLKQPQGRESMMELFENIARSFPEHQAVSFGETSYTYRQLNELANRFAGYLKAQKQVQPGDVIALLLERSEWMIVSILAVLKAGAAYLPIDAEYPEERIRFMKEDGKSRFVIDRHLITEAMPQLESYPPENLPSSGHADALAYVIYTSGSTGTPKGIAVGQASVINLVNDYQLSDQDIASLTCNYVFDVSVLEIFSVLLKGGHLVIPKKETVYAVREYAAFIQAHRISTCYIHPFQVMEMGRLLKSYPDVSLKRILIGVEPIRRADLIPFEEMGVKVINGYGPTETTVCSTMFTLGKNDEFVADYLPVGRPVANTDVYILDEHRMLVPLGVQGEIYIGGAGLSKGYLNRPELSAEKFVTDPFHPERKLFRTGDYGKWLPDGNLLFIGRKDNQIKINGLRVELGEIETVLAAYEPEMQAVVLMMEMNSGAKELVAFIRSGKALDPKALKIFAAGRLPVHMVPKFFIEVDEFPVNTSGKLDKAALRALAGHNNNTQATEYQAPETDTQKKLVEIWTEVMELDNIGILHNFLEIGGHSLTATLIISRILLKFNIKLGLNQLFSNPTIKELSVLIDQAEQVDEKEFIKLIDQREFYELSHAQRRLWIIQNMESGLIAYNVPVAYKIREALNPEALQFAIDRLVERHEILRSTIVTVEGEPLLKVHKPGEHRCLLEQIDAQACTQAEIDSYVNEVKTNVFDLANDMLMRVRVLKLGQKEFILVACLHHIVCDAWSIGIMYNELMDDYHRYPSHKDQPQEVSSYQYKEYAHWQNNTINTDSYRATRDYWHKKLSGNIPFIDLPLDKPRPKFKTYNGSSSQLVLKEELVQPLRKIAVEKGVSMFAILQAALKILLYRCTGQKDILIGTPVACRTSTQLESMVGFFVNTIVLRDMIDEDETFHSFLEKVQKTTADALDHQEYPFDKLVDELDLKRSVSRSPLFDVFMTYLKLEMSQKTTGYSYACDIMPIAEGLAQSKFDISFDFYEEGDRIAVAITYNDDLFVPATITRLLSYYVQIIRQLSVNLGLEVKEVDILSEESQVELIGMCRQSSQIVIKEEDLLERFYRNAISNPHHTAIISDKQSVSYGELNDSVEQLAAFLQNTCCLKPEDKVGICMNRTIDMVVMILAVIKSGAAYVPLDPSYPVDRIHFIINDISMKMICVDDLRALNIAPQKPACEIFEFSQLVAGAKTSGGSTSLQSKGSDLAYVLYTSGSTGTPKGVMIERRNVNRLLSWAYREFAESPVDTVYATTSICFDLSVFELFYCLNAGKTMRLLQSGIDIEKYIEADRNVLVNTVPSVVKNLLFNLKNLANLKVLNMAGEVIPEFILDELKDTSIELRNLYGPSEDTTYSSCFRITSSTSGNIPIGKPLPGTSFFIIDENRKPVPEGMAGEIWICGQGLSRGYHHLPEMNRQKFVTHDHIAGERLYRTGDLGRLRSDGNFEFLGRMDRQVKIRGHRIETQEIESRLNKIAGIKDALVTVYEDKKIGAMLVAYVIGNVTADPKVYMANLRLILPDYMIPDRIIVLEKYPLLPNGKIDRLSLPKPELIQTLQIEHPRNEKDEQLLRIWEDLFGKKAISIDSDFFEMGGHSLLAGRLVSRIVSTFGRKFNLNEVYAFPTIRLISDRLEKESTNQLSVPLSQLSADKPNVFLISPVIGSSTVFKPLAVAMEASFNVYGINYKGFETNEPYDKSIEEIAYTAKSEIEKKQASGDYLIVGYSMGGLVAFELARLLEKEHKKVKLVILDISPKTGNDPALNNPLLVNYVSEKFLEPFTHLGKESLASIRALFEHNLKLMNAYRTVGTVEADILVMQARESSQDENMMHWGEHTNSKFALKVQAGDHHSILYEDTQLLGKYIENWFDKK